MDESSETWLASLAAAGILVPANATRKELQKLVATTVGALPEEELVRDGEFISAVGDERDHQIDDELDEEIAGWKNGRGF